MNFDFSYWHFVMVMALSFFDTSHIFVIRPLCRSYFFVSRLSHFSTFFVFLLTVFDLFFARTVWLYVELLLIGTILFLSTLSFFCRSSHLYVYLFDLFFCRSFHPSRINDRTSIVRMRNWVRGCGIRAVDPMLGTGFLNVGSTTDHHNAGNFKTHLLNVFCLLLIVTCLKINSFGSFLCFFIW